MAVIIGIDEAGYGPILGPLVACAAAFKLPDESLNESLWDILRRSICRMRSASAGRVVVNDSKKLHNRKTGFALLQRGVLSFLHNTQLADGLPVCLGELLQLLQCEQTDDLESYPWFNNSIADWPLNYDTDDIQLAAAAMNKNMRDNHIEFLQLYSRILQPGRFNDKVEAVDNKASVLFSLICELVDRGLTLYGKDNLQFVIDKQSGRSHYRRPLQQMFPALQLKIIREDETTSSYQLTGTNGAMKIHFLQKGDQRQLPVALASMTAKYLRELFMEVPNRFFQRHCPGLTGTAGYYTDGRRFLADLETYQLSTELTRRRLLIRQR